MKRFFLLFCALLLILFSLELWRPVQHFAVVPWTHALARLSGAVASFFDADVVAQGSLLLDRRNGSGVSIEAGCNGVEACLMLIAAMLAFPTGWRQKLKGVAIGVVAVQAVNVLRVISLFYLLRWDAEVFNFAHLYLWQALIMLDVLVVWLLWIRRLPRVAVNESTTHG